MKRFECRWVREPNPPEYAGRTVLCSDNMVEVSRAMLGERPREVFMVWFLDGRNKVLGFQIIHEGAGNQTMVDPGDVLAQVLMSGARAWIAVHNHPSGDHSPSVEDILLTKELWSLSKRLKRDMLDHIVVSDTGHTSFAASGMMPVDGVSKGTK